MTFRSDFTGAGGRRWVVLQQQLIPLVALLSVTSRPTVLITCFLVPFLPLVITPRSSFYNEHSRFHINQLVRSSCCWSCRYDRQQAQCCCGTRSMFYHTQLCLQFVRSLCYSASLLPLSY
jgi:hypothetical protein